MADSLFTTPSLNVLLQLVTHATRDEALSGLEALPVIASTPDLARRAYLAQTTRAASLELGRAAIALGYMMALEIKASAKLIRYPPIPAYMRGLLTRSPDDARLAEASHALASAIRLYTMVTSLQTILSGEPATAADSATLADTTATLVAQHLRQGALAADQGRTLQTEYTSLT